jgi:type II secretory ATPase GspE/PulE/Tfp pilus assembly ATPase PilB-like protein
MPQQDDAFRTLADNVLSGIRQYERLVVPTVTDAPIVSLVNQLINEAIESDASDIHIEPVNQLIRIRLRIDGELSEWHQPLPAQMQAVLISRIKIMSQLNTTEHRLPQDGRISYPYHDHNVDIRVSTMPVMGGEKLVLRLLNGSQQLKAIAELDLSAPNETLFRRWSHMPYGLIASCGPVNSGKTTSLYAALNELNSIHKNIVTIEDPIEYSLSGVNQIQVNTKMELTFAAGLRSILRQDPDIIMVGEIRDEETAEIAIRAALTGRLLFTTLHTGDAVGSIFRLLDMGIMPYLLSAALIGIVAQRLVRRLCPQCRELYTVESSSPEAVLLGRHFYPGIQLYHARGCEICHHTGYRGRLAIHELLPVSDILRAAILQRQDLPTFRKLTAATGMTSLLDDGIEKSIAGLTTIQEVRRTIYGEF